MKENAILLDGKLYLETKFRIREFRKNPSNKILTDIVYLQDNMAIVKASALYNENVIAEAYAARHIVVEEKFLEMAETAAIGRALSDAGYNLASEEFASDVDPLSKTIALDDGTPYLEVVYRIAWMRREHPDWVIRKQLLRCTEFFAIVQCKIIDVDGNVLSMAHARRQWKDSVAGRQYVESAETAAVGRALSMLGYDLPPEKSKDLNDGTVLAEAPIAESQTWANESNFSAMGMSGNQMEYSQTYVTQAPVPVLQRPETIPTSFQMDTYCTDFDANAFIPEDGQEEVPFFQNNETKHPEELDTIQQEMQDFPNSGQEDTTLAEAENCIIPFGVYTGRKLKDILIQDRKFIEDLAYVYKGNPVLTEAAKRLIS